MRKLGDQWIEVIDGQEHMFKAVLPIVNGHTDIKDLGVLNEDGCLPSPWGGYPKIIHQVDQTRIENGEYVHYDNLWCVEIHEPVLVCTDEYLTKQQAKDAWNRRT